MKRTLLLFFFLSGFGKMEAQYNNNFWVFGDSCGIEFNNGSLNNFRSSMKILRGSASISNAIGLSAYSSRSDFFITLNSKVWNKYHQQMQNGDYIYGSGWYHERLFLPVPGSDSLLYLFSCCVTSSCPFGLYYTLIDLTANNDSGAIVQKNVPLNSAPAFDGLMAVQHGNGRDWWLLYQRWSGSNFTTGYNNFFVYLIDSSGINLYSEQFVGQNHSTNGGHLIFSPEGAHFANVSLKGLIQLYNFDRCTGLISLWETVQVENLPPINYYYMSTAFSSDVSKLYVSEYSTTSNPSRLLQYDLTAPVISASKTTIYQFLDPSIGVGDLKLAPDSKIYLGCHDEIAFLYPDTFYTYINQNLSVINQPDSLGLACDFQPFSFYLGGARTYYGLPNNPDYELGAWVGSPCDTLTVGQAENDEKNDVFFQAWYNHEWNMIHVNASKLKGKSGVLRLFDVEGRVVYERKVDVIAGGYFTGEIGMNDVAAGVYIVSLKTEQDKVQGKVLKF
ncbi:MAG: T9SS type A sorting domain-containing protein [Bacteroidetes bacterium]|nr:T9SS type A sorting domain-containing protein [Bacteroidota bacterium]